MGEPPSPEVAAGLAKAKAATARAHLFLCLGPECAPLEQGAQVWDYLKRRVSELGLEVMRTKAQCLRVCADGPWLVVYPDGLWYGGVTVERCERILREHIQEGRPVVEWIAAQNPLKSGISHCAPPPNLQP